MRKRIRLTNFKDFDNKLNEFIATVNKRTVSLRIPSSLRRKLPMQGALNSGNFEVEEA
jgi:hypothetical protein